MYPIHPVRPAPTIRRLANAPRSRVPTIYGGSLEEEDETLRSSEYQSVVNDFNQLRNALHQRNINIPELANRTQDFLMWADQVRYNVRRNQERVNRINDMMRMINTIWNERVNPTPEPIEKIRGGMMSDGASTPESDPPSPPSTPPITRRRISPSIEEGVDLRKESSYNVDYMDTLAEEGNAIVEEARNIVFNFQGIGNLRNVRENAYYWLRRVDNLLNNGNLSRTNRTALLEARQIFIDEVFPLLGMS